MKKAYETCGTPLKQTNIHSMGVTEEESMGKLFREQMARSSLSLWKGINIRAQRILKRTCPKPAPLQSMVHPKCQKPKTNKRIQSKMRCCQHVTVAPSRQR